MESSYANPPRISSNIVDETAPLLPNDFRSLRHDSVRVSDAGTLISACPWSWSYVAFLCGALSLVADLGDGLTAAPEVRLLEMAVCRDYYRVHNPSVIGPPPLAYVREELCKLDDIQVELAYLRALKSLFMTIPGLLCTVSFGRVADVWGRKPVLLLGMTGQILSYLWVILVCYLHEIFPTRLVWLSAVFQLLGGGHRVIFALINTVIVDVAPETARTSTFYLIGAAIRVTDMFSSVGGSLLLSKDLWLPYKVCTPVILMSLPIALALPETLSIHRARANGESPDVEGDGSPESGLYSAVNSTVKKVVGGLRFSHVNRGLAVCLCIVFVKTFSLMSNNLYLQFASKALHWTIAKAGYLLFIRAAASLGFLLCLPLVTRVAEARWGFAHSAVDTWVARGSLFFLALGSFFIGVANSTAAIVLGLILASAGNGITQTMRGLVANFADASNTGQLYTGLALLELAAILTGNMAFAALFSLGTTLSRQGWHVWLGLPFFAAAIVFLLGLVFATRLPTRRSQSE